MDSELLLLLAQAMVEECLCATIEEAAVIVESMMADVAEDSSSILMDENSMVWYSYFDTNDAERIRRVCHACQQQQQPSVTSDDDDDECCEDCPASLSDDNVDDDASSECEMIGPGDCELCERSTVNLTRHHLIPKSTWSKLSWEALCERCVELRERCPLPTVHQKRRTPEEMTNRALPSTVVPKQQKRRALRSHTCTICRGCHTFLHRTFSNTALAWHYNTVEKLLDDERMYKHAKWSSTQRR